MEHRFNKKNLIWNMLGSLVYAITSMVLGIVVTRMVGDVYGGIFFFAFSTLGQQLYILAYFGMRPIQVTDTGFVHTFREYLQFRILTCTLAMGCGIVYALLFADGFAKQVIYIAIISYKVGDGFLDCIESEFQRRGRLYKTGQSLFVRTVVSLTVFLLILMATKSLFLSSLALLPALCIGFIAYMKLYGEDFSNNPGKVGGVREDASKESPESPSDGYPSQGTNAMKNIIRLFHSAKWLFISSFLDLYVFAAAKFAVNDVLGEQGSTYFSIIFIPTSVINLLAGFIIRPVLTKLSLDYEQGRWNAFSNLLKKISGIIVVLTLLGMGAAYLFGIPVLLVLLGEGAKEILHSLQIPLVFVILGGGFYAILNLMYYALVILKRKGSIFLIYLIGTVLAFFLCNRMVKESELFGAALSYMLVMCIMMFLFLGMYMIQMKNVRK